MRTLVVSSSFEKKLRVFVKQHVSLGRKIQLILHVLCADPFSTGLKTHQLSGRLKGLYACSIDYHYRLVFFENRKA